MLRRDSSVELRSLKIVSYCASDKKLIFGIDSLVMHIIIGGDWDDSYTKRNSLNIFKTNNNRNYCRRGYDRHVFSR